MSTRSQMLSFATILIALGVGLVAPVHARENGVKCNPNRDHISDIEYGQFGVHNKSTTSMRRVWCSGGTPGNGFDAGIAVNVYDRSPSQDVCCIGQLQNPDGSLISNNTRCSSGSGSATQVFTIPTANVAGFVNMICDIPPNVGSGLSHVTNYHVFPAE
jgi:hypothetical protein